MTPSTDQDTGENDSTDSTYVVETSSQGKHYLVLPAVHLTAAGLQQGDDVSIQPINYNGKFCVSITPGTSVGMVRTIRSARHDESTNLLTIPKRVATAANLSGEPVSYHSGDGSIVAIINRTPYINHKVNVYDVTEKLMTRWKNGMYAFKIPRNIQARISIGEKLWFWYDILADGFVMVLEPDRDTAPDWAIELNVHETNSKDGEPLVNIPKQVCDSLEVNGEFMRWGHDEQRILGLFE